MRHLLFLFFLALLTFSCSNKFPLTNSSGEKGISDLKDLFVAENNPDVECYRIPALNTTPNGDVLAAIDERIPGCADLRYAVRRAFII